MRGLDKRYVLTGEPVQDFLTHKQIRLQRQLLKEGMRPQRLLVDGEDITTDLIESLAERGVLVDSWYPSIHKTKQAVKLLRDVGLDASHRDA